MRKNKLIFIISFLVYSFLIGTVGAHAKTIGPEPITKTDVTKGTLFVSPNGAGSICSKSTPCNIWNASDKAKGGDVVFLRGGIYALSKSLYFNNNGSAGAPIIFESYPDESVVFDGSQHNQGTDIKINVNGSFIQIRGIEIKNMPVQGIYISGTDNVFDGLHVHHSGLSGIQVFFTYDLPYGAYGSRNIIRNCTVHDNSGAGNFDERFKNGGNSDGISISSGTENRVENCLVYGNSDDGIDTWRSTYSYVGYSISHSNGIADGNGNGIKAGNSYGGKPQFTYTTVEHNLSYSNKDAGISYNNGGGITISYNTTWNNLGGYEIGPDNTVINNIASETSQKWGSSVEHDNSWQRANHVTFIDTNPASANFLVPTSNSGFADIGAFVNVTRTSNNTDLLPDVIVTQLSYANGIFTCTVKNQGTAATPAGVTVGVGYLVDGKFRTWGDKIGSLAAGESVTIGTRGGSYVIPNGAHTIMAYVDDVNRFKESNESNNQISQTLTIP